MLVPISIMALIFGVMGQDQQQQQQQQQQSHQRQLPEAISRFSQSLYQELAINQPNAIYSPYSAHLALSMALLGAEGQTKQQMLDVLQLDRVQQPHQKQSLLLQDIQQTNSIELLLANALYVNPDADIKNQYQNQLKEYYQSSIEKLNFQNPLGPEADINQFVEEQTKGRITEILQRGDLNERETALVLINTLFLNATFIEKFPRENTRRDDFKKLDNSIVKVDMMRNTANYPVKEDSQLNSKIVKLPFIGEEHALVIVVPNEDNGLTQLEQELAQDPSRVQQLFEDLNPEKIELSLPRFNLSADMDLQKILVKLGMDLAFSEGRANFSQISNSQLFLSKAVQKAVIEVTEEGTVAAAATALKASSRKLPEQIRVDHPFLYFIIQDPQKLILFQGKLSDPSREEIQI